MRLLIFAFVAIVLLQCLVAATPSCTVHTPVGTVCKIAASVLRPTQFGIGVQEVNCKKHRFEQMSPSKLQDFLSKPKHYVPVITGIDADVFYITDHHHQVRALVDANISKDDKVVYANITFNGKNMFSHHRDLIAWMVNNNKFWLYDEKGLGPISPSWIPADISDLQNDFYRSLAYYVKHAGGYGHVDADFSDFQWSNFLRQNVPLPPSSIKPRGAVASGNGTWTYCGVCPYKCIVDEEAVLQKLLPLAMKAAKSGAASGLPGFGMGVSDPIDC